MGHSLTARTAHRVDQPESPSRIGENLRKELALRDLQAPLLLLRVGSLFFDLEPAGYQAGKPLRRLVDKLSAAQFAPTAIRDLVKGRERIQKRPLRRPPLSPRLLASAAPAALA